MGTVPAPLDRVYAAFVDREAMVQWLPPSGMTARFERFDAVDICFIELVPGVRVVQAVAFESDDPALTGTMTMTWELVVTDDGTRVEIRAEDVPDGISASEPASL